MVVLLIRRWSSAIGWRDSHRYALTFGAMLVPLIGGFVGSRSWLRTDLIGKSALDGEWSSSARHGSWSHDKLAIDRFLDHRGRWCVLVVYVLRGATTASADIEHQARTSVISRIPKIVEMLYLLVLIYCPRLVGVRARLMTAHLGQSLAGVALCAAGVVLVIASRRALGRNWGDLVVLKRNHELIQRGPYCWVRRPLYNGMLLAILGSAVTVNMGVACLAVLVVLLGFWVKSRQEEILLEQHFQNTGPTGTG